MLAARASKDGRCPLSAIPASEMEPFIGSLSFQQFNMIVTGVCAILVLVIMYFLILLHSLHLSVPREQYKILKIIHMLPMYAVFSFLGVAFPTASPYLENWVSVFEALALGSYVLLICEYAAPEKTQREVFFASLNVPPKHNRGGLTPRAWFKKCWICVFQYPVVALVLCIVADITQAFDVYCTGDVKPRFSYIYITVIQNISISVCIISVVQIFSALYSHVVVSQQRPLAKLLAFKLVVFFSFVESVLFLILRATKVMHPTRTLSYFDVHTGIPNMVLSIQTVFFAALFPYAYTVKPYLLRPSRFVPGPARYNGIGTAAESELGAPFDNRPNPPTHYQGGFCGWRGIVAVFSPVEIWRGIGFGVLLCLGRAMPARTDAEKQQQRPLVGSDSQSRLESADDLQSEMGTPRPYMYEDEGGQAHEYVYDG